MTQQEFATFVGCSRVTILNLERDGHPPQRGLAEKIAKACGVSTGYVFGIEPEKMKGSYVSAKRNMPITKDYYIVAYKNEPDDNWKSYCVAFWNGKCFQKVDSDMMITTNLFDKNTVTDWMPLPMAD